MGARGLSGSAAMLVAGVVWLGLFASGALAAVTPGWECIPTSAGQAVVSGGTGSAPSCGAGATAVLAPTYVSSGVGGKPTVKFSAVNVQILNGAGSTASINGTGNTLDNVLTGNSAVNTLTGGAGNDTYVVSTGDTVVEAASAGTDTVQSDVTQTLAANVENLVLTGTNAINGTGNASNN